jgi:hypothetical protein
MILNAILPEQLKQEQDLKTFVVKQMTSMTKAQQLPRRNKPNRVFRLIMEKL